MQLSLQVFEYQGGQRVRTAEADGQIWFVAKDICDALEIADVSSALRQLDDDEKGPHTVPTPGGNQEMLCVNEPGLYSLVMKSRKPEAKAFKRWITHDVLPSIRRTGGYLLPGMRAVPVFVRRFNDNWESVSPGHFSVISELFIRVYGKLEQLGCLLPDNAPDGKEIRPDVSVGKLFPRWLEENYPEHVNEFEYYSHKLPEGFPVKARQYKNHVLPAFIEYIEESWIPNVAYKYFQKRAPLALPYIPKMIPSLEGKTLKVIKG